jgi:predicted CopG family antitoxin
MNMVNELHQTSNRITVTLSRDTYDELIKFGNFHESMDDVVQRVLKQAKKEER